MKKVHIALSITLVLALFVGMAQADGLSTIQDRGYLIAVMSGGYPPFSFFDENQNLVGYDADVARAVADQLGVTARVDAAEFSTIVQGVQSGIFDIGVASQAYTAERAKAVEYLDHPYHCGGAQLFVPKDSDATSIADLDQPVAVALGTTYEKFLTENNLPFKTFKDDPTGLQAVESGIVGGIVTDLAVGSFAAIQGAPIKPVGDQLYVDLANITLRKGEPALKAALNDALQVLNDNGTLKEISMKWFNADIATRCFTMPVDSQ